MNRLFIVFNDIHLIPCIGKNFSLPQHLELLCCSPGLLTNMLCALSSGLKGQECETDFLLLDLGMGMQ